jgi:hypothetical protein
MRGHRAVEEGRLKLFIDEAVMKVAMKNISAEGGAGEAAP